MTILGNSGLLAVVWFPQREILVLQHVHQLVINIVCYLMLGKIQTLEFIKTSLSLTLMDVVRLDQDSKVVGQKKLCGFDRSWSIR